MKKRQECGLLLSLFKINLRLHRTADRYVHDVVDGDFLTADVEGIESVGAVGAVL